MSAAAPRFPAWPRWRTVCAMAVCAAAGGGLRMATASRQASGKSPDTSPLPASSALSAAASVQKPDPGFPPLTPDTLPALSQLDRLQSLAARLPEMTVAEIGPLVRALMSRFPEAEDQYTYSGTAEALMPALLMRWAELDAPGMIATLEGPEFRHALSLRQAAVRAWAELKGIAVLETVAKQWPGPACRAAWDILQRRPEQLEALLPLLIAAPDGMFSWIYENREFQERLGPERYWRLAAAHKQVNYMCAFLSRLNETDPGRASEMAKSLPQSRLRDDVLQSMLNGSPNFRSEYEALPHTSRLRHEFAESYAELMAKEDPEAALTWARSLTSGIIKAVALRTIAAAEMPPADRMHLMAEAWMADPGPPESAPVDSFKVWYAADPNAAESWLETVPHAGLREALTRTLNPADGGNSAAASEWLEEFFQKLAEESPHVAEQVAFYIQLTRHPAPAQITALEMIAIADPDTFARNWSAVADMMAGAGTELPADPRVDMETIRNRTAPAMVSRLAYTGRLPEALQELENLTDPAVRAQATTGILAQWMEADPAAARAAFDALPLTALEREHWQFHPSFLLNSLPAPAPPAVR